MDPDVALGIAQGIVALEVGTELVATGTGQIPLERCCHHFDRKPTEANRRATRQSLPVSVFRLGNQKSPLVAADVLAAHIDGQRDEATMQRQELRKAS